MSIGSSGAADGLPVGKIVREVCSNTQAEGDMTGLSKALTANATRPAAGSEPTSDTELTAPNGELPSPLGEWTLHYGRRRGAKHEDSSILLWNVPDNLSATTIVQTLATHCLPEDEQFPEVTWEGAEGRTRVRVRFRNAILRNVRFGDIRRCGQIYGWVAKPSRMFHKRVLQRRAGRKEAPKPSSAPTEAEGLLELLSDDDSLGSTEGLLELTSEDDSLGSANDGTQAASAASVSNVASRPAWKPGRVPEAQLRLGTLNIAGGLKSKVAELEDHMSKGRYDLVGLCDTQMGAKTPSVMGFHLVRGTQGDKRGVALLVAQHLATSIRVLNQATPDQLWVMLPGSRGEKDLYVCVAYMPLSSDIGARSAYDTLADSVACYKQRGAVVLLGDLNAWLGRAVCEEDHELIGPYGDAGHQRNRNGFRLLEILSANNLRCLNGFSQPPAQEVFGSQDGAWYTRRDPYHGTYTMIDYIVASPEMNVKEFGVDYTDLQSDHFLVSATVCCALKARRQRGRRRYKRYLTEKFREGAEQTTEDVVACQKAFQGHLLNAWAAVEWPAMEGNRTDEDLDTLVSEKTQEIVSLILDAAEASVGSKICTPGSMRSWWNDEVKQSIKDRRDTYTRLRRGEVGWREYAKARATSRRLVGRKKKEEWDKLLAELPATGKSRYMKRVWGVLNQLRAPKKTAIPTPVLLPDGELATTLEERSEAWAEYMERLGRRSEDVSFNDDFAREVEAEIQANTQLHMQPDSQAPGCGGDSPTDALGAQNRSSASDGLHDLEEDVAVEQGDSKPQQSSLEGPFSSKELTNAVTQLKLGKAAGPDLINNEMLKAGGKVLVDMLLQYYEWLNDAGVVPREWGSANVVTLHKKGDVKDPGNYRTISLISCLGKLYLTVWTRRVSIHMNSRLGEDQGGFRDGRSTDDQVYALYETLIRRKKEGKSTYLFFIDFRKAFDTVWHEGLFKRMWDCGIRGKALQIVKSLYRDVRMSVMVDGTPGRPARIEQGVRQGCPLSPVLFSIFVEELATRLREVGGVDLDDRTVHALLFADDVVVLAESPETLQTMIEVVDEYCREWRMSMHAGKSEVMIVAAQGERGARAAYATQPSVRVGEGSDEADLECNSSDGAEKPTGRVELGDSDSARTDDDAPLTELCSDDDASPAPEDEKPYQWSWRGKPLGVVSKYKYLGMWIDDDLSWRTHLKELVAKGKAANHKLGRLLSLRAVPTPLKKLVWTSVVRSKLDHGSTIYRANSKQAKALESIQHQACVKMLAANRHTAIPIARSMVGLKCSLKTRRAGRRMMFFHSLANQKEERWPKHLFSLPKVHSRLRGPQPGHWPEVVGNEVVTAGISVSVQKLCEGSEPLTSEPAQLPEIARGIPKKLWRNAVKEWVASEGLKEAKQGGGSASDSRLYMRLIEGCNGVQRLQSATISLATSADVLRVRLLCGTSALHGFLGRYSKHSENDSVLDRLRHGGNCPCCEHSPEEVEHLLMGCAPEKLLDVLKDVRKSCTCDGTNCGGSFGNLDVTDKLLFLLGQSSVTGKSVEKPVDQVLREYLVSLWQRRSKALADAVQAEEGDECESSDSGSEPDSAEAENLKKGRVQPDIRSFFSANSSSAQAGLEADGQLSML